MEFIEFLKDFDNLKPKQIGEVYKGTDFKIKYIRDIKKIQHYNIEISLTNNIISLDEHPEHIIKTLDTELLIEQADNSLEEFFTSEGKKNFWKKTLNNKYSSLALDFKDKVACNVQTVWHDSYIIDEPECVDCAVSILHEFKTKHIKINGVSFRRLTYKQWKILYRENIIFITDENRHYIEFPLFKHQAKNVKENGDFDFFENGIKKGSYNIFNEEDLFYLNMKYGI